MLIDRGHCLDLIAVILIAALNDLAEMLVVRTRRRARR
jgi:hypothetical protein